MGNSTGKVNNTYNLSENDHIKEEQKQKCFIIIKPGNQKIWGKIIGRLIDEGFSIEKSAVLVMDDEFVENLFIESISLDSFDDFKKYMMSGKVLCLEVKGVDIIERMKSINGPNKKIVAKDMFPNSFMALYGINQIENVCYVSDSPLAAERDIKIVFRE